MFQKKMSTKSKTWTNLGFLLGLKVRLIIFPKNQLFSFHNVYFVTSCKESE